MFFFKFDFFFHFVFNKVRLFDNSKRLESMIFFISILLLLLFSALFKLLF
jgi:hypothetical protein